MNSADKAAFKGFIGLLAYVCVGLFILFQDSIMNQPFIKALFPLPFPNGNISYYDFVNFFFWIIGFPIALWWFVIRPIGQVAQQRRGFRR